MGQTVGLMTSPCARLVVASMAATLHGSLSVGQAPVVNEVISHNAAEPPTAGRELVLALSLVESTIWVSPALDKRAVMRFDVTNAEITVSRYDIVRFAYTVNASIG
ncbi:MAG: hypothetical protein ABIW36_08600 [Terrimesophilobacter sp.]